MKTIMMTREKGEKWLKALRGGEYKQGKGSLYNRENNSYCCLGVLQHCLTGKVEAYSDGDSYSIPTLDWLDKNDIKFFNPSADGNRRFESSIPFLPKLNAPAAAANDGTFCRQYTFLEIADAIEATMEYTD